MGLKAKPALEKILDYYGIEYRQKTTQKIRCVHPDHEDRDASCSLDLGKEVWNCFACGQSGDAITLIQLKEGLEVAEAFEFGQAFVTDGAGQGVSRQPRRGSPLALGQGYRPQYRRPVPPGGRPARPFG